MNNLSFFSFPVYTLLIKSGMHFGLFHCGNEIEYSHVSLHTIVVTHDLSSCMVSVKFTDIGLYEVV